MALLDTDEQATAGGWIERAEKGIPVAKATTVDAIRRVWKKLGTDHEFIVAEVAEMLKKSTKSITRIVRQGLFPHPVYVGSTHVWRTQEFATQNGSVPAAFRRGPKKRAANVLHLFGPDRQYGASADTTSRNGAESKNDASPSEEGLFGVG